MSMSGLSIGKTALQAHQRALEVTSQNLANANTEGYARKTVSLASRAPLNLPDVQGAVYSAQIGMGVEVSRIESIRDLLLNAKIRDLTSDFKESDKTQETLDEVEALFVGEIDLAESFDDFFSALHDLAGAPDSLTVRSVVRARAVELTDRIQAAAVSIEEVRADISDEIRNLPARINTMSAELAKLNEQVAAMESNGMQGNDFEDKRQLLLEDLAEIADVTTVGAGSTLTIILGGQVVVQGTQSFEVQTINRSVDQFPVMAVGTSPDDVLAPRSGLLKAYTELQDGTLQRMRGDLNELAVSLSESFNTIHRTGFGLDGTTGTDFFTLGSAPAGETRLFSVLGDTFVPEPTVALDGLTTTTQPENFETNPIGVGAFVLNGRSISYDGAVDSLVTLADRINASGADVTATITPENRLMLSAQRQSDYVISNVADSGNLLARLGILPSGSAYPPPTTPATAVFSGTASLRPPDDVARRIAVSKDILNDLNKIAAAKGDDLTEPPDGVGDVSRGPGDGANALLLAGLQDAETMSGSTGTFNEFIVGMLGTLGVEAGAAKRTSEGLEAQIRQLEDRRQEIQGVSIDEELINMIKYQRGFEAASRIINVMDEVLQTLLALGR